MLEVGRYSLTELKRALGITDYSWRARNEEYEEYFKEFFDYELKSEGRKVIYDIKEWYKEWVPLPKKYSEDKIERDRFYKEETDRLISKNPWNTGSNIAQQISDKNNRYCHATGTIANYVRPILKQDYVLKDDERVWMEKDYDNYRYMPLTKQQLEFLNGLFQEKMGSSDYADLVSKVKAGYLTDMEAGLIMFNSEQKNYDIVMQIFKARFGFRPIKVGQYIKRGDIFGDSGLEC